MTRPEAKAKWMLQHPTIGYFLLSPRQVCMLIPGHQITIDGQPGTITAIYYDRHRFAVADKDGKTEEYLFFVKPAWMA